MLQDFVSSHEGLFGEGPAERRERLRHLLADLGEVQSKKQKAEEEERQKKKMEVGGVLLVLRVILHQF